MTDKVNKANEYMNTSIYKRTDEKIPVDDKGFTIDGVRVNCTLGKKGTRRYVLVDTPFGHFIMNVNDSQYGGVMVSANSPVVDIDKLQAALDASVKAGKGNDARKILSSATKWNPYLGRGLFGYLTNFVRDWVNAQDANIAITK